MFGGEQSCPLSSDGLSAAGSGRRWIACLTHHWTQVCVTLLSGMPTRVRVCVCAMMSAEAASRRRGLSNGSRHQSAAEREVLRASGSCNEGNGNAADMQLCSKGMVQVLEVRGFKRLPLLKRGNLFGFQAVFLQTPRGNLFKTCPLRRKKVRGFNF